MINDAEELIHISQNTFYINNTAVYMMNGKNNLLNRYSVNRHSDPFAVRSKTCTTNDKQYSRKNKNSMQAVIDYEDQVSHS